MAAQSNPRTTDARSAANSKPVHVGGNHEEDEAATERIHGESFTVASSASAPRPAPIVPSYSGSSGQASQRAPTIYSCRIPDSNSNSTQPSPAEVSRQPEDAAARSVDYIRPFIAQILARSDVNLELVSMRNVRESLIALGLPGVTVKWAKAHKAALQAAITAEFDLANNAWKAAGSPSAKVTVRCEVR